MEFTWWLHLPLQIKLNRFGYCKTHESHFTVMHKKTNDHKNSNLKIYLIFHVHTNVPMRICPEDMKFLLSNLWSEGLPTDNNNDVQWIIHDNIDSLAFTPNE